eukprot:SAG11_NODE_14561_length_607_cov_3.541339_1_plen_123_part_00
MHWPILPRYLEVVKPTVGTWKKFPRPIFFYYLYNPVCTKFSTPGTYFIYFKTEYVYFIVGKSYEEEGRQRRTKNSTTRLPSTGSKEDIYQIYYRYLYLLVQVPDLAFGGYYIGKEYLLKIIA